MRESWEDKRHSREINLTRMFIGIGKTKIIRFINSATIMRQQYEEIEIARKWEKREG